MGRARQVPGLSSKCKVDLAAAVVAPYGSFAAPPRGSSRSKVGMSAGAPDGDVAFADPSAEEKGGLSAEAAAPAPAWLVQQLSTQSQEVMSGIVALNGWPEPPAALVRLMLHISAGRRQGLLDREQCERLYEGLEAGQLEAVGNVMAGMEILLESDTVTDQRWVCGICDTEQGTEGWRCPEGHRSCAACMRQHIQVAALPRCLAGQCCHELSEADFKVLGMPAERLEAFRQARLQNAIEELCATPGRDHAASSSSAGPPTSNISSPTGVAAAHTGEVVVNCPNKHCQCTVLVQRGGRRFRHACSCGSPPFCARCREVPYHYHAQCSELQALRERWLSWVSAEDRACLQASESSSRAYDEQVQALRAGICRRAELEANEKGKEQNCRLCPHCRQPNSKAAEGSTVVCGQQTESGAERPGCGATFRWRDAPHYEALVESRPLPQLSTDEARVRGRQTRHVFVNCSLCGSGGDGIVGLRFRCIHCQHFSVCADCEPKLPEVHEHGHVFEIFFGADFAWEGVHLPPGTAVRTVRRGETLPWGTLEDGEARVLPESLVGKVSFAVSCPSQRMRRRKRGTWGYHVEFEAFSFECDDGYSGACSEPRAVEVAAVHLEPVLASRAAAEELLSRALREEELESRCRKQERAQSLSARVSLPGGDGKASERLRSWRQTLFQYSDSDSD